MKLALKILCFYFFVFSINLVFFPIRLRLLLSFYGLYLLVKKHERIIISKKEKKLWRGLFFSCACLILVLLLSSLINGYFDGTLFKYPISVLISLTSAYGFIAFFERIFKESLSHDSIMKYIIITAVFECLLTVVIFIYPALRDALMSLVSINEMSAEALDMVNTGGYRFAGIGAAFFGGGIFYSICLFLIAIRIIRSDKVKHQVLLFVAAMIITIVGTAVARTTLVGFLAMISYLLIANMSEVKKKLKIVIVAFLGTALVLSFFTKYLEHNEMFEDVFERAFSLFYIYQESGELESTESMMGGFVKPEETKTWIIGDGMMADPKAPTLAYYKGIDRGFWRLIWGYGIIGLIVYCVIQWRLCRLTKFPRFEYLILFIMFCGFLQKGLLGMDFNMSLFIMLPLYKEIELNKQRRQLYNESA